MNTATICTLNIVFSPTAVISVVTGGVSLFTVPVMMRCGMCPTLPWRPTCRLWFS